MASSARWPAGDAREVPVEALGAPVRGSGGQVGRWADAHRVDGQWVGGISYWSDYVTIIDIDWPGTDVQRSGEGPLPLAG